ncbi:MAG: hypothetical protein IPK16_15385 [Anaerolineales bacterium]|nr:hypothetical protein [Anaerolineales bacterium]
MKRVITLTPAKGSPRPFGKGCFIASLVAFVPFIKRHRSVGIAVAAVSLVLVALYSTWWMWWGGYAWGPRFLVPLTPLWVLVLAQVIEPLPAPGVETVALPRRSWLRWLVYGLAAVSFVVQLGAVSVNFVNYETALRDIYETDWLNPLAYGPPAQSVTDLLNSPVIGQFKLMQNNFIGNTDLAWLWADGKVLWLVVAIGMAAIATLVGLLLLWWRAVGPDSDEGQRSQVLRTPTLILVLLLPVLVIGAWLGEVSRDPLYGAPGEAYRGIVADLCRDANSTDAFVNVVPTAYQIPMNWMPGACNVGVPTFGYATNSLRQPETQAVLEQVLNQHDRVFFATSGVQPNDPDNTLEQWLGANAYKATDNWYADYRLLQYATPLRLSNVEDRPINKALLGKQAEQVTILSARTPSIAPAGEPIPVDINFRLEAPTDQNLRWFVQLWTGENIPLAQFDSGPDANYTTFSSLPAREELLEKAGVLIPANTPEGTYRLIAGLYNPDAGGARLVTIDGPDWIELGDVRVVKGE